VPIFVDETISVFESVQRRVIVKKMLKNIENKISMVRPLPRSSPVSRVTSTAGLYVYYVFLHLPFHILRVSTPLFLPYLFSPLSNTDSSQSFLSHRLRVSLVYIFLVLLLITIITVYCRYFYLRQVCIYVSIQSFLSHRLRIFLSTTAVTLPATSTSLMLPVCYVTLI